MPRKFRLPYTERDGIFMPLLPVTFTPLSSPITLLGLVDSGATVNVLPYDLGLRLGLVWDDIRMVVALGGNLSREPAKAVVLPVQIGDLAPLQFGFAWSRSPDAPLILGQTNFFQHFNVCFFGSENAFEVTAKS